MKNLGLAKQILGIKITRGQSKRLLWALWLSQERYVEQLLGRFNMHKTKFVNTPLTTHFKLSMKTSPASENEEVEMKYVPYLSVVGSLVYAMICTRPNIAYALGVVRRFLTNPRKEHWLAIKWML